MRYFRKQFDGQWKIVRLEDEEIVKIEGAAVSALFRAREKILAKAAEKKITLTPTELSAMLQSYQPHYETLASDFIEARAAKTKEATKDSPPY